MIGLGYIPDALTPDRFGYNGLDQLTDEVSPLDYGNASCGNDTDRVGGQTCASHTCAVVCTDDAPCGVGEVCAAGICADLDVVTRTAYNLDRQHTATRMPGGELIESVYEESGLADSRDSKAAASTESVPLAGATDRREVWVIVVGGDGVQPVGAKSPGHGWTHGASEVYPCEPVPLRWAELAAPSSGQVLRGR